jgi:CheY-like chemotaxis protein
VGTGLFTRADQARDGNELVRRFSAHVESGLSVDLALIDLALPGSGGLEAARGIRAIERGRGRRPVAMVLLANAPCDDGTRAALRQIAPAYFLDKRQLRSVAELPARLAPLLDRMRARS